MRCEVLQAQQEKQNNVMDASQRTRDGKSVMITDLEVWREPTHKTALSVVSNPIENTAAKSNNHNLCDK